MEWLTNPEIWIAFITLCSLEIVLGIDNLVFISILANKLPEAQQARARNVGLSLAMITRIILLFSISWIMRLTADLFQLFEMGFSGRDIILILGGLFLIYKSVVEIHKKMEDQEDKLRGFKGIVSFRGVIFQILLIDIVFSLDSVITAVGMVDYLGVMIAAVIISMIIMILIAGQLSRFVNKHPAVKVLALSFLLMIGIALIAEGMDFYIPKGYIYFAMAFALFVELINIRTGSRRSVTE